MLKLNEYITEYVSSGRGRTHYDYGPTICGKSKFKDICKLFMESDMFTDDISQEYIGSVDRNTPIGLPKHIDFSQTWFPIEMSLVTRRKRIVVFVDLWSYLFLDFDENDFLSNIERRWTTSGKLLDNKKALDYTVKQVEAMLIL
jgi:hypothetical protein